MNSLKHLKGGMGVDRSVEGAMQDVAQNTGRKVCGSEGSQERPLLIKVGYRQGVAYGTEEGTR